MMVHISLKIYGQLIGVGRVLNGKAVARAVWNVVGSELKTSEWFVKRGVMFVSVVRCKCACRCRLVVRT